MRMATPDALIDRTARKLLRRVNEALDAEFVAPTDLDKLSDVVREVNAVFGALPSVAVDKQRAELKTLQQRAEPAETCRELRVVFGPGVEEAAK